MSSNKNDYRSTYIDLSIVGTHLPPHGGAGSQKSGSLPPVSKSLAHRGPTSGPNPVHFGAGGHLRPVNFADFHSTLAARLPFVRARHLRRSRPRCAQRPVWLAWTVRESISRALPSCATLEPRSRARDASKFLPCGSAHARASCVPQS